jgi:hypothetical protein
LGGPKAPRLAARLVEDKLAAKRVITASGGFCGGGRGRLRRRWGRWATIPAKIIVHPDEIIQTASFSEGGVATAHRLAENIIFHDSNVNVRGRTLQEASAGKYGFLAAFTVSVPAFWWFR